MSWFVPTAALGTFQVVTVMMLAPAGLYFEDKLGMRLSCFIGAFIAIIGFICSYFATNMYTLFIAYGLVTSVGMAMSHLQGIAIQWHLFEARPVWCT